MHRSDQYFSVGLVIVLCAVIFAIDMIMPLGATGGMVYLLPVLIAFRAHNMKAILWIAAGCTVLILLGQLHSPGGLSSWQVHLNRLPAIIAVWLAVWFMLIHKSTETMLIESRDRLMQAEQAAGVETWEVDLEHYTAKYSDNYGILSKLGLMRFEDWINSVHPHDRQTVRARIKAAIANPDQPYVNEYRLQWPDGSVHHILSRGVVIRNTSGKAVRMIGSNIDMTQLKLAEESLIQSEQRFNGILESSADGKLLVNDCGEITFINEKLYQLTGYERDELIGRQVELLVPARFNSHKTYRSEYFYHPKVRYMGNGPDLYVRRKDGSEFPAEISLNPMKTETGYIVAADIRDISDRKRAEERLRKINERLDLAVRGTSDGLWDWDIRNDTEWWSPRFYQLLGYRDKEIPATYQQFQDLLHPDDLDMTLTAVKAHLEERKPYDLEFRMQVKTGEYKWFHSRGQAIRDEGDNPLRMAGSIRDVTDRKEAEKLLRKSEEKFATTVYATTQAVLITQKKDGMFLFVNPGFIDLFGYAEGECLGKTSIQLNLWTNLNDRFRLIKKLEQHNEVKEFETELHKKSGDVIPVSISASGIVLDNENCYVSWIRDLRHEKQIENERLKLERNLFRSQKMDAIGQLTGGIAHDFNNILSGILGYTRLARNQCDNGENKLLNYLNQIQHSGERARDLIRKLMIFSREIPGDVSLQSLQSLLEDTLQLLFPVLPSSIVIKTDIGENISEVLIDPVQFEQIVMNLCINARDAIQLNGEINITLDTLYIKDKECSSCHKVTSGHYVCLHVRDSGSGIPNEQLPSIFEPFYTTKETGKGTGLGLSMVHGIMHNCGGHIMVDSILGQGTAFHLLFPMASHGERGQAIPSDRHNQTGPGAISKENLIMVIDDEVLITDYMNELLKDCGYDVITANNSEEALQTFKSYPDAIDMVITDQTMPGITGIELTREILSIRPELPVIICTGYSEQINEAVARQAGVASFLIKPVDAKLLMEIIHELLKENTPQTYLTRRHM